MGLFDGIFSTITGGLLGGIFGQSEADQQQANSKELMELQFQQNKEIMQHKHQWEVDDLRNAGLNPILTQGGSTGTLGTSPAVGARPSLAASAAQLSNIASQTKLNEAQADAVRVQAASSAQQAASNEKNVNSMVESRVFENELRQSQTLMSKAGVSEINQRILNSVAELNSKIKLNEITGQAALMSASAHQQQADASSLMAQVAAENGIAERDLKNALTAEGKERLKFEILKVRNYEAHHQIGTGDWRSDQENLWLKMGEMVDTLNPFKAYSDVK